MSHKAKVTAMENRLRDMLQGAYGGYNIGEDESPAMLGAETLARFAGAVVVTFGLDDTDMLLSHLAQARNIEEYDDIPELARKLVDAGYPV